MKSNQDLSNVCAGCCFGGNKNSAELNLLSTNVKGMVPQGVESGSYQFSINKE